MAGSLNHAIRHKHPPASMAAGQGQWRAGAGPSNVMDMTAALRGGGAAARRGVAHSADG
jgi:hypothetical protein